MDEVAVAVEERLTEADVLRLLHDRFTVDSGNGPRFVPAFQVRSHAGFDARRTCDFMALDLWPSSGLVLVGVEVKVSRGDWLRELREPEKSAEFRRHCDYWWLASPPDVARVDELPAGWGWLTPGVREAKRWVYDDSLFGSRRRLEVTEVPTMRVARQAPRLKPKGHRDPLPRSFFAAFSRAAARTAVLAETQRGPWRGLDNG